MKNGRIYLRLRYLFSLFVLLIFLSLFACYLFFLCRKTWLMSVSVANAPGQRSMSSHDDHASCPQCRMAAGEYSLDFENHCRVCEEWTSKQWGKLRRSLVDARARASQRGRQHWSAAFPRLKAWILSKPVSTSGSGPVSEFSSQAGEGDFEDNILVSTPNQQVEQVLVVQAQNGVNMASGTATTAPSTAPLQVAGPSTMEPIVVQLGQDTPSVIQGARPDVRIEQTVQSIQRYGTLPYISGPPYTAPLPSTAPLPYAAYTPPLPSTAPLPYSTMPLCLVSKAYFANGLLWPGQSVPFCA